MFLPKVSQGELPHAWKIDSCVEVSGSGTNTSAGGLVTNLEVMSGLFGITTHRQSVNLDLSKQDKTSSF